MTAATSRPPVGDTEDLDNLFNYDAGIDDFLKDFDREKDSSPSGPKITEIASGDSANLGIDEEIKITRKRQPVAKLDESRLLSAAGIPRLKRISKERLKFKGKGHEFSDVSRLLNMYQLWLDDLYPRAKFADALTIVEKVGHSKRMQMQRKEWIYEARPKPSIEEDADFHAEGRDTTSCEQHENGTDVVGSMIPEGVFTSYENEGKLESTVLVTGEDEPEDDELDALLAEGSSTIKPLPEKFMISSGENDEFADEMEAMVGFDEMW